MKKNIALLFFLLAAFVIIFLILRPSIKQRQSLAKITTFEQCVAAGYPVMESYPRQCSLPDGRLFVESSIKSDIK